MITSNKGDWGLKYRGLSTDEKPEVHLTDTMKEEEIPNGSEFHEMDKSVDYMWDAENKEWLKQRSGGGGGGGVDPSELGNLAYADDASTEYTPEGKGKLDDQGKLPELTTSINPENPKNLIIGFDKGRLSGENVTFTGTKATITVK